jgi:hypothetical protein
MNDYSKMSDEEVSARVGDLLGVKWANIDNNYHPLSVWGDGGLRVFNPCNSWADSGPIIVENKISLNAHGLHAWMAWKNTGSNLEEISSNRHQHSAVWDNPLRAAMIVFLMMKEPENDS